MEYIPQVIVGFHAHDVAKIVAIAGATVGSPLKIEALSPLGRDIVNITFFTDDQSLTDELAAAINGVFAKRAEAAAWHGTLTTPSR